MYLIASVVVVALVILVAAVGIPFFLRWIAEENILFTTVREGTIKAIMRGNGFERFIMAFDGYHLNDPRQKKWHQPDKPDWEALYHGKGNEDGFMEDNDYYDTRSSFLKHLGLYWVGWPWANSVYVYAFEWNETYTNNEGKEKVLPRAEASDFIYAADFTYAIVTEGAETNERLPTDELTLVTVAIRNPYRALFSGEDWIRRVTAAINRHVRTFVGGKDFLDLISTRDLDEFSSPIIELTNNLPDDKAGTQPRGLRGRYGVEIRTADLQTIELSGEAKQKHQDATTTEYTAKQDAAATLLKGTAEADVIRIKGEQEALALKTRLETIAAHDKIGIALAGYDAIQESSKGPGNTIIWANNPLPNLTKGDPR